MFVFKIILGSKQAEELGNQKKAVRVEEKERQRKQRSERSVEDLNIDEVFTDKFFKTLDDEEEDQEEDQEQMVTILTKNQNLNFIFFFFIS